MRRSRTLSSLPDILPRRIRLVKLLRAHGLRDAERLREDELMGALSRLKIILPSPMPLAAQDGLPGSANREEATEPASVDEDMDDRYDDPHALPRFREPKIWLPEGERTFLRLIAVDPTTLFITWDLDNDTRNRIDGDVFVELVRLDVEDPDSARIDVDLAAGGWYLSAPDAGATVMARLCFESNAGRKFLVESNAAIVPPNRASRAGEVVFATIPPRTDRRALAGGALLTSTADALPPEVTVQRTGELVTAASGEVDDWPPAGGLPGSASRANLPSSRSESPPSSSESRHLGSRP